MGNKGLSDFITSPFPSDTGPRLRWLHIRSGYVEGSNDRVTLIDPFQCWVGYWRSGRWMRSCTGDKLWEMHRSKEEKVSTYTRPNSRSFPALGNSLSMTDQQWARPVDTWAVSATPIEEGLTSLWMQSGIDIYEDKCQWYTNLDQHLPGELKMLSVFAEVRSILPPQASWRFEMCFSGRAWWSAW